METIIDFISQPWHWSVSGLAIVLTVYLLLYAGKRFGVSTSYKAICGMSGVGRKSFLKDYDWRKDVWLIYFIIGSIGGGWLATSFLSSDRPVQISQSTIDDLAALNIKTPTQLSEGLGFVPEEIFRMENLFNSSGIIFIIIGGFLIGFGTRWAGGCTSGHAISGLSNLQLPSLVAVVGFFIGGLLITHLIMPFIL